MTWITPAQLTERRKAKAQAVSSLPQIQHKHCKCGQTDPAQFSPLQWNRCKACTAQAKQASHIRIGDRIEGIDRRYGKRTPNLIG